MGTRPLADRNTFFEGLADAKAKEWVKATFDGMLIELGEELRVLYELMDLAETPEDIAELESLTKPYKDLQQKVIDRKIKLFGE